MCTRTCKIPAQLQKYTHFLSAISGLFAAICLQTSKNGISINLKETGCFLKNAEICTQAQKSPKYEKYA